MRRATLGYAALFAAQVLIQASAAWAEDVCPPFRWGAFVAPGDQTYEVVGRHTSPLGHDIFEVHFGEIKGENGKIYLFAEYRGDCLLRVVSAGSYDATNAMHQELNPGIDYRLYHIDLYSDVHATLGFHQGPPDLEAVRAHATQIFSQPPDSGSNTEQKP